MNSVDHGPPAPLRAGRLLPVAVTVVLFAMGSVATGAGEEAAAAERPPGTLIERHVAPADAESAGVWLVSTRRLGGVGRLPTRASFDVERRVVDGAGGHWQRGDLAGCTADSNLPLVVFIHGNRYDSAAARSQGVLLAERLAAHCPQAGVVQTVIFSWPSSQQGILLRDGRLKYDRARADGHYLARFLADLPPHRPVALVGYSFGAFIAIEALADLVAAERDGRADVPPWSQRPGRTHIVFVAPAVRCDAFAPRGPYRAALTGVDRLTLVINSKDHALKFFPFVERGSRAEALGSTGMPRGWLGGELAYDATDAAGIVGRQHGLPLYLASPVLVGRMASGALGDLDR